MNPAYGVAAPGYRLPDELRLGAVRLQVSDLERSIAFYERVLGLSPERTGNGEAVLVAGGSEPIVEFRERPGAAPVPRRGLLGLYHFAILLPSDRDLGAFLAHVGALGVPVGSADHAVSQALYFTDPDGLGIEVYADRPAADWRTNGGELYMTSAPLDASALIAVAQNHPWSGMPAGTRMGHVHLHVGHLRDAESFYHEALGFDKMVWSYPGALFLSAGGYHHHLGVNTWAAGAPSAGHDDARLLEWRVVLPSVDEVNRAAAALQAVGAAVNSSGNDRVVDDPWGTTLRVTA